MIPLAGHELGHSIWHRADLQSHFLPLVKDYVVSELEKKRSMFSKLASVFTSGTPASSVASMEGWVRCQDAALRQVEELFCDSVGIRLFGLAYLHSFAYLLSPNPHAMYRSWNYPNTKDRVGTMLAAAGTFGLSWPDGSDEFSRLFSDLAAPSLSDEDAFLLSVADQCSLSLREQVIDKAKESVPERLLPDPAKSKSVLDRFGLLVPATRMSNICDIINAGWEAMTDSAFWNERECPVQPKRVVINELVLKSVQVYEFEQITNGEAQ